MYLRQYLSLIRRYVGTGLSPADTNDIKKGCLCFDFPRIASSYNLWLSFLDMRLTEEMSSRRNRFSNLKLVPQINHKTGCGTQMTLSSQELNSGFSDVTLGPRRLCSPRRISAEDTSSACSQNYSVSGMQLFQVKLNQSSDKVWTWRLFSTSRHRRLMMILCAPLI